MASQWESRNTMMSPVAALAPSVLALMRPSWAEFLTRVGGQCTFLVVGKELMGCQLAL